MSRPTFHKRSSDRSNVNRAGSAGEAQLRTGALGRACGPTAPERRATSMAAFELCRRLRRTARPACRETPRAASGTPLPRAGFRRHAGHRLRLADQRRPHRLRRRQPAAHGCVKRVAGSVVHRACLECAQNALDATLRVAIEHFGVTEQGFLGDRERVVLRVVVQRVDELPVPIRVVEVDAQQCGKRRASHQC